MSQHQAPTIPRVGLGPSRNGRPIIDFAGAIVLALAVPYIWMLVSGVSRVDPALLQTSMLCNIVAAIASTWISRNLETYPGVSAAAYVFPATSTAFGVVALVLLATRLSYSFGLVSSAYVSTTIWLHLIYLKRARNRPTIGVIPFGNYRDLMAIDRVAWVPIVNPSLQNVQVNSVAVDLRQDLPPAWEKFLADCALAGVPVYHSKTLSESLTGRVEIEHLSENSFGTLAPIHALLYFKSVCDWIIAFVALVITLPLSLVVAIVIKLDTPGPAIFRQVRMGYRRRPFTIYKFRTMRMPDAVKENDRDQAVTMDGDQRVTRVGRFLRKSRLDEIPQLMNILLGQMSIIGPRPEALPLSQWYEDEIPFYHYRHIVKPGITGWAQINQGHVADIEDVTQKLHYDFFYIKNFSPWLDSVIALRTLLVMINGFGAR